MKKNTMRHALLILSLSGSIFYSCNGGGKIRYEEAPRNAAALSSDCANLSQDEKIFAAQLSEKNQALFCKKFSSFQRKTAMQISKSEYLTPDNAVEAVSRGQEELNRDNRSRLKDKTDGRTYRWNDIDDNS